MKLNMACLFLLLSFAVSCTQSQPQSQAAQVQASKTGHYYTPASLLTKLKDQNPITAQAAQAYLVGAYDMAQDAGQSCAQLGTTTPTLVEKVFTDYLQAHPGAAQEDRTAAGIAAQAFADYWPCQKR